MDDHCLLTESLRLRLDAEPDLTVVGTAATADEAVADVVRLRPAIVLMDIEMPGRSCFDAIAAIQARCPETRVLMLSGHSEDRFIEEALRLGVSGYVTKNETPEIVITAVHRAAAGSAYFSPQIQARLIVDIHGARLADAPRTRGGTLTRRELEVLRHLALGSTSRATGVDMNIATRTVERHIANLMRKLNIHDRVQLVLFAVREGLVSA